MHKPIDKPNEIWCARERCGMPYVVLITMACVFVVMSAWIVMFAIRTTVYNNHNSAAVACITYNITRVVYAKYCEDIFQIMSQTLYGTFVIRQNCDALPKNFTKCYKINGELYHKYPQTINISALTIALIITGVAAACGSFMACILIIEIYCERKRANAVSDTLSREIMLDNPHGPISSMDRRSNTTLLEPMLKK